jgi:chemotaxis protein histidine kinase CheA
MSLAKKPQEVSNGTLIYDPDKELSERFSKQQRFTTKNLQVAYGYMQNMRLEYMAQLEDSLGVIRKEYRRFREQSADADASESLRRYILDLKSSAGMFGFPLISSLGEQFFEIFDRQFDMRELKVQKALDLHIQTLNTVVKTGLRSDQSDEAKQLIGEFKKLNRTLEVL